MLNIEQLFNNLTGYLEARFALAKLEVRAELAKALQSLVVLGIALVTGFFALVFFSLAMAAGINYWLCSAWLGYFFLGLLYTFCTLIVLRNMNHPRLQAFISEKLKTKPPREGSENKD